MEAVSLSYLFTVAVCLPFVDAAFSACRQPRDASRWSVTFFCVASLLVWLFLGWALLRKTPPHVFALECVSWWPNWLQSRLVGPPALRCELIQLPSLLLLPLLRWTTVRAASCTRASLMWGALTLLTVANDVLTLSGSAIVLVWAIISLFREDRQLKSAGSRLTHAETNEVTGEWLLSWMMSGWGLVLLGCMGFVAAATVVRTAPQGLPGSTTTVLSDLAAEIAQETRQHPARELVWLQFQRIPVVLLLAGTGLLAGFFPLHLPFLKMMSQAGVGLRLLSFAFAKLMLILFWRLAIQSNVPHWTELSHLVLPWVLAGFVIVSLQFFAVNDYRLLPTHIREAVLRYWPQRLAWSSPAAQISDLGKSDFGARWENRLWLDRLFVWTQHLGLLALVVLPEQGALTLMLTTVVQLPALVGLELIRIDRGRQPQRRWFGVVFGMICVLPILTLPGVMAFWQFSLELWTWPEFRNGGFELTAFWVGLVVVSLGLLQSVTDTVPIRHQPQPGTSSDGPVCGFDDQQTFAAEDAGMEIDSGSQGFGAWWIVWLTIAILGSILISALPPAASVESF